MAESILNRIIHVFADRLWPMKWGRRLIYVWGGLVALGALLVVFYAANEMFGPIPPYPELVGLKHFGLAVSVGIFAVFGLTVGLLILAAKSNVPLPEPEEKGNGKSVWWGRVSTLIGMIAVMGLLFVGAQSGQIFFIVFAVILALLVGIPIRTQQNERESRTRWKHVAIPTVSAIAIVTAFFGMKKNKRDRED